MADIQLIQVQSILSPASGYIDAFDYTITPYAGCTFGCAYCYVPTLFYFRHYAPTWGQALKVKANAPALLRRAAENGKLVGKRIYLSPSTDSYLPQEREYRITRQLLEVFAEYPPELLVIQTRSPYVLDDLDLLEQLSDRLVVGVSISTDREDVRAIFERTCPSIGRRVEALAELHGRGIRTQASLAPLLPCDPIELACLVDAHASWVVAQALKAPRAGAHTPPHARELLGEHGWEGWLDGGHDVEQALDQLRQLLGSRLYEGREGFNLGWMEREGEQQSG